MLPAPLGFRFLLSLFSQCCLSLHLRSVRPERNHFNRRSALICAIAVATGCGLDANFSELGDKLLSPDVQGFDIPGRLLMPEAHTGLSVQSNGDGDIFALGLKPQGGLSVHNLLNGTQCEISDVLRYPQEPLIREGAPALIPLLRRQPEGDTALQFSTFQCEIQGLSLAGASWGFMIIGTPEGPDYSLLVRRANQLHQLDPWREEQTQIARSVRGAVTRPFGYFRWIENGQLIFHDENLDPLVSLGKNVRESTLSVSLNELSYIEGTDSDEAGGTLYTLQALSADTPELLDSDACALGYLNTTAGVVLSYYAPCDTRNLILLNRKTGLRQEVAENVLDFSILGSQSGGLSVAYLTNTDAGDATGSLWLSQADADPVLVGENAVSAANGQLPNGDLLAIVDYQSGRGGRLVRWTEGQATSLADGVFELGSLGRLDNGDITVLVHVEDQVGDILRLHSDGSTEPLVSKFLRGSVVNGAYLGNFREGSGTLFRLDRAAGRSETIADRVGFGGYWTTLQWPGWRVLSDSDPALGGSQLTLHLEDPSREFPIATGVTEVREVASPSRGIIYGIAKGESAGVWFSRAK